MHLVYIFVNQSMHQIFSIKQICLMQSRIPLLCSLETSFFFGNNQSFAHPTLFRSTIGALQYLTYTRPDISFSVNKLSQFLQAPTLAHWKACKCLLRYIKGILSHGLTFTAAPFRNLKGFSDTDWASNLDDSGMCIFLGSNLYGAIIWVQNSLYS